MLDFHINVSGGKREWSVLIEHKCFNLKMENGSYCLCSHIVPRSKSTRLWVYFADLIFPGSTDDISTHYYLIYLICLSVAQFIILCVTRTLNKICKITRFDGEAGGLRFELTFCFF